MWRKVRRMKGRKRTRKSRRGGRDVQTTPWQGDYSKEREAEVTHKGEKKRNLDF